MTDLRHVWVRDTTENWIRADFIVGLRQESLEMVEGSFPVVFATVLDGDGGSPRTVVLYRGNSTGDKSAATDLATILGYTSQGTQAAWFVYADAGSQGFIWQAADDTPKTP